MAGRGELTEEEVEEEAEEVVVSVHWRKTSLSLSLSLVSRLSIRVSLASFSSLVSFPRFVDALRLSLSLPLHQPLLDRCLSLSTQRLLILRSSSPATLLLLLLLRPRRSLFLSRSLCAFTAASNPPSPHPCPRSIRRGLSVGGGPPPAG